MSFCKEFNAKTAGFLVRDDPLTTSIVVDSFRETSSSLTRPVFPGASPRSGHDHRVQGQNVRVEDEEPADVLLCQESRGRSLGFGSAGARTNGADIAQARVPHCAVEISRRGRATHRDGIHVPVGDKRGQVHGNRGGAVIRPRRSQVTATHVFAGHHY